LRRGASVMLKAYGVGGGTPWRVLGA
jgi:hypothetical protein